MSIVPRRAIWSIAAFSIGSLFAAPLLADGSKDDYDRAAALRQNGRNKVFHDRVTPNWLSGGKQFWYEVTTGPGSGIGFLSMRKEASANRHSIMPS